MSTFSFTDTLTAVGPGREFGPLADFNTHLDFTSAVGASVVLQRKRPDGTWATVTYSDGSAVGPFTTALEGVWTNPRRGMLHRWYVTAITSGSVIAGASE